DALGALESLFALDDVRRKLLPTSLPLEVGAHSSDYGWRTDPFSGQRTYHEGIDFMAEHGAPILAAAGGVVVYSDFHPQYGNMLEIDHGNGLVTRYAHAAKRLARVGDVVTRGAQIGEVGSSGRSTGNHLHFEVRRNGAPLNPAQFLRLRG
ncbi:MAG TPA: M23 family metallopeptidase, partial [Burkholderiales bacterium]|nr:M23 family metallopeptidase [Burkholderiales bacterium]